MGWYYPNFADSRKELIDYLLNDSPHYKALKHCTRGNCLWVVWQPLEGANRLDNWIGCYLMQRHGDTWGYKPLAEDCGLNYCHCPLSYLELAPAVDEDWRADVRAYHARKARLRRRKIEHLDGNNNFRTCALVDTYHVSDSLLHVCRRMKRRLNRECWDQMSKPLRSGFFLAVINRHMKNRRIYREVMGGSYAR